MYRNEIVKLIAPAMPRKRNYIQRQPIGEDIRGNTNRKEYKLKQIWIKLEKQIQLQTQINIQIYDLTCEGDLCDRENVWEYNWIDPVVPVVLRHNL